jgi:CRISPR-associated protein Cas2
MYVLITYDVATDSSDGKRRLRQVSRACERRGQRVQYSVFECKIEAADWVSFREELVRLINPDVDSLRFYKLGRQWKKRVEHHGANVGYDVDGPLLA